MDQRRIHRGGWALTQSSFLFVLLAMPGAAAVSAEPALSAGKPLDLQGELDRQLAAGKKHIVLPPGRHRVTPHQRVHLRLQGVKDVEIVADGVEMICTETTRALTMTECENVMLRGLTIDYDPLPYTQGRIIGLSADSMVHEIELFAGYPPADDISGEKYEIFRGDTRTLRFGSYHQIKTEKLSPTRIRVTKAAHYRGDKWKLEQPGDIIVIATRHAPGGQLPHAIALDNCKHVTLEDVTLYASNSFGFWETGCDGSTYRRCRVDRCPRESDLQQRGDARVRSLNADAFHSEGAVTGPAYLQCFARFQGDDCINICGRYHLIMRSAGNTLRVLANHRLDLAAGDPVELLTYDGRRLPDTRLLDVKPDGQIQPEERQFLSKQKLHDPIKSAQIVRKAYQVTLVVPATLPMGSLIAARNRMGEGFKVVGCRFGYNRSRGILIKASHGEVSGNELDECWEEAIKVAPEYYWLESGSSDDVVISNNRIRGCKDAAIAVYAHGGNGKIAPAGLHNNIRITGNRVDTSPPPGIVVTSTTGLLLRDNSLNLDASLPQANRVLRTFHVEKAEPVLLINVEDHRP